MSTFSLNYLRNKRVEITEVIPLSYAPLLGLKRRGCPVCIYSNFDMIGILKKVVVNLTNSLDFAASLFSIQPRKMITDDTLDLGQLPLR